MNQQVTLELIEPPEIDLAVLWHVLILTGTGLVIVVVDLFYPKKRLMAYIALVGVVAAGLASMAMAKFGDGSYAFYDTIVSDNFSLFFSVIFCLGTALTILISVNYAEREAINYSEYYVLLIFATVGMIVMASASDLITVFLGLELMSIALYVLAGINRASSKSAESSLKYFLLGAFATCFLLYGIAFVYGAVGSTNLNEVASAIREDRLNSSGMLYMGVGLITIGLGFKVASVPFHMWTPDVYEGAPTSVTAFMSVGPKAAGFAAFFRVYLIGFSELSDETVTLIWILAALSMTVGSLGALLQENIKRMLGYSSIAHVGYVLVALVAANEMASPAVLYYMLTYCFMNIGLFAVVIALSRKGEESPFIKGYAGLAVRHPVLAFVMSLFLFSLAGIPPLAGFMAKFYVFSAAISAGYVWLTVIAVVNSVIGVYVYLRITVLMYMTEPEGESPPLPLSPFTLTALVVAVMGTLYLGIFPSRILELARNSGLF